MKKHDKNNRKPLTDVSDVTIYGMPENAFEMVNKYGTYNIQPTADTENMYPTIAQGYNEKIIKTDCENKDPENVP